MNVCENHDECVVVYDSKKRSCPLCDSIEMAESHEERAANLESDIAQLKDEVATLKKEGAQ